MRRECESHRDRAGNRGKPGEVARDTGHTHDNTCPLLPPQSEGQHCLGLMLYGKRSAFVALTSASLWLVCGEATHCS